METKVIIIDIAEILRDKKQSLSGARMIAEGLRAAATLLKQGEVVAFPTETVYGLGANALDPVACKKIFSIKGRPSDNPLIVHLASIEEVKKIVLEWPEKAQICAEKFWPGPLTLVLPKAKIVPPLVSGGLDTVAVRIPSNMVALALIRSAGCPIAAPSANISGKPSPTEGKHVWQDFQGKIPLLIDAGPCPVGLESTVLDLSGPIPVLLRPGGVTFEQLSAVLGRVEVDSVENTKGQQFVQPKSPGMKYRHYAPHGEIAIISSLSQEIEENVKKELRKKKTGQKIAFLCMEETVRTLSNRIISEIDLLFILGSREMLEAAASRLFEGLRLCDEQKVEVILVEEMPEKGIGLAFMNRLKKAAGKRTH